MKRIASWCVRLLVGVAFIGSLATSANAAVVNPDVGGTFVVKWVDGLGQIDQINSGGGFVDDSEFSITVAENSILSFVSVLDCCVVGDLFELTLDGLTIPWTTESGGTGSESYQASLTNLFLSAGTHTISLVVTALAVDPSQNNCDPCLRGDATVEFGTVSAVPLPPAFALMLLGLGGFGLYRRLRA